MNISIEYLNKISQKNKNIVIFVSNISQLKNIEFPPIIKNYVQDSHFRHVLQSKKIYICSNILIDKKIFGNITIVLIDKLSKDNILLGSKVYNHFKNNDVNNITFIFADKILKNNKKSIADLIFGFCLRSYNFLKYKKNNTKRKILNLYKVKIFKELTYNFNLLKSINFAKDLVSEPANILNPVYYETKCKELKKIGLKVKSLNKEQLQKIGMKALLGVAEGTVNDPRVIIFEWNIKKNIKPTILAGKGVTFDSGGISLKPPGGMEEMITDMAGSAVVVGSMMNAALNKSSKSLVGIIGLVENMPDGKAQRPGDIVTSLSGQTIEILNTDAEGRLVLADIITYIQKKYNPKEIVDFATLTGAIMIALGTHKAGLFSNNDKLSKKLLSAGELSGEKIWRLPIGEEYDSEINSSRADMKNIGSSRYGGSIHAAQFIHRFIKNQTPWAHLDVAGVSWTMKGGQNNFSSLHTPGATGFGIQLIDQFLKGK